MDTTRLKSKFFYALFFLFIGLSFLSFDLKAQKQPLKYYAVIGGFAVKENAERFTNRAIQMNFDARYGLNQMRQVYYVYVFSSTNKTEAFEYATDLKSKNLFSDCWVFNGVLEEGDGAQFANIDQNPETGNLIDEIESTDLAPKASSDKVEVMGEAVEEPVVEPEPVTPPAPTPAGKPFVFRTVNQDSGKPVTGLVRLQEASRSSQYRGYKSNDVVYVIEPGNRDGKWYLYCSVVGFREYKMEFDYNDIPNATGYEAGPNDEFVISLMLERVRKGDYIEMDRVDFLKNASIMTPASEDELKELVAMMEENPNYHIRVHGHTNGNEKRDVITLGSSTNLFAIDQGNKRFRTSGKELSKHRAEVVKKYLVNNGISDHRISVKGDGGSQMIHGKGSTLAGSNDRIEIEITRN
jgi:outer membrane protein OmpA-like peptidoglycan-associated protein